MYNPADHYWVSDTGRVYSSVERREVQEVPEGRLVSRWPEDADGKQSLDALQAVPAPFSIWLTLDAEKDAAARAVDDAAEVARHKYLTPGLGQALTYQAKIEEIRRYDQDTNPVKADYPYMSAEIGVTGASLTAVADAVRAASNLWQEKSVATERMRLKAKADIAKAETVDRIQAIVSAIEWP